MPVYEEAITIKAGANAIFAFASDAANMPKYLSTVTEARDQGKGEGGEGRILMKGEANGHPYQSDGWIKYVEGQNTMTWGSDGENDYSGSLEVDDAFEGSLVTVRLNFEPKGEIEGNLEEQTGSRDESIREGLRTSLQSLKNHIEGTGGKEDGPAETVSGGRRCARPRARRPSGGGKASLAESARNPPRRGPRARGRPRSRRGAAPTPRGPSPWRACRERSPRGTAPRPRSSCRFRSGGPAPGAGL